MVHRMMKIGDEFERQTTIRLRLLKNGYRPLPTAEKVAFQKGWPEMEVSQRTIKKWPMFSKRYEGDRLKSVPAVTSAIQLTGTMLAIDVDVVDSDVSQQIEDLICDTVGPDAFEAAPMRTSGGAKFMMLFRTEEPYRMRRTTKYEDPDGGVHQVELYGAGATRYFSCFGPHTLGDIVDGQYEIIKEYEWVEGPTPLDTRPSELPLVSKELLDLLIMRLGDLLAEVEHFEPVRGTRDEALEGGVKYDLTPDMQFETKDGLLDYEEAMAYAATEHDARCSASFEDGGCVNLSKCRMSLAQNGEDDWELSIFNHETWVMHYPASWAPKTQEERRELVGQLGAAMRDTLSEEDRYQIDEAEEQGADVDAYIETVEHMLFNRAYNVQTGNIHRLDYPVDLMREGVTAQTEKGTVAHLDLTWEGPRGGQRRLSPVDTWRRIDEKIKIAGARFDPRSKDRLMSKGNVTWANTYRGLPVQSQEPALDAVVALQEFLEHLVPDEEEREWLLDWLADKYQRPWNRNCGVVFVAPGIQGAGRGTLYSILGHVFGQQHVTKVREADMFGNRFNDYLEDTLLVLADELGGMSYKERKAGYEELKSMVDPRHTSIRIERKGISSYDATIWCSFMFATNNPGALPIDSEDRRFAIITNGGMLKGDLAAEVFRQGEERLAQALAAELTDRVVTRRLVEAPAFKGREHMLNANDTDLDDAIRAVVERAPWWRAWARSDFEAEVKLEATGSSSGKVPGLRQEVTNLVGRRGERVGAWLIPGRVNVVTEKGKTKVAVVAKQVATFEDLSLVERGEALAGTKPEVLADIVGGEGTSTLGQSSHFSSGKVATRKLREIKGKE